MIISIFELKEDGLKTSANAIFIAINHPKDVNDLMSSATDTVFYFSDKAMYEAFKHYKNAQFIQLSEQEKKTINYDTLSKLKSMASVRVKDKYILDQLTVNEFSFWYYNRFRIYFDTRNVCYETGIINQLLDKHENVTVYSHFIGLQDYYSSSERLTIKIVSLGVKQKRGYKYLFKFSVSLTVRFFSGLFLLRRFRKHHHAIITTPTQFSRTRKEKRSSTNNYYGGILDNCEQRNIAVIDQLMFPKVRGKNPILTLGQILHKRPYTVIGGEFIVVYYGMLRMSTWKKVKKDRNKLKLAYTHIKDIQDPVHRLMLGRLMRMHATSFLYLMQYHAFRRLFAKGDLRTVTTIDENSPNPKSILDAAKFNNIKTIGIQHGSIHNLHPAYIYGEEDTRYRPFPDLTLLWGNYFRELLLRSSAYKEDQLGVIGQLRLDSLFTTEFKENDRSERYFEKSKTSVLFASQPQRDPYLRKQAAVDVMSACKGLENTELIIKIHPNEEKEYYKAIADSLSADVKILKYEANLYHLLERSDVVITCFSTVGAEAIFLRKPLIILDHLEQDVLGYIAKGVALKAVTANDLSKCITTLIDTQFAVDKQAYDTFIDDFAFKIDGKVAERCNDIITSF